MSARTRSVLYCLLLAALSGGIGWLFDRSMPVGPRWELGPGYKFPLAEYTAGRGIWVRSRDGIALHDLDRGMFRCFDLKVGPESSYVHSPNGRYLAFAPGDESDTLYLLDAQDQTLCQRKIQGLDQRLRKTKIAAEHFTFSPKGDWLYLSHTREVFDTSLAVLATIPAGPNQILHVAFEGDGPRLKVWLRDPHLELRWDPGTQAWEITDEVHEIQAASDDRRYVLLQDWAKSWKLQDLQTGTTQHLGRVDEALRLSLNSSVVIEQKILHEKEAVQVTCRVWSIGRGEWSKPFAISEGRGIYGVAADEQSILVNREFGGVDVIDFRTGEPIA